MKLVFSIVSHNQSKLVQNLLISFDNFLRCCEHEVLIVVTENVVSEIKLKSRNFKTLIIHNLRQKGFGANHNAVFERFDSDVFFIVNPDIFLFEEVNIDHLIKQLVDNHIDISSPKILSPDKSIEDYKRADLSILNLCKRKFFKNYTENFDWLAGMFLILKSDSFRKLKGFDTDFFMYVEDCDLCMRAKREGMQVLDINTFSVVHDARRASTKSLKHFKWHILSLLKYWLFK